MEMVKELIKMVVSIVLVMAAIAASFSLGQCYYKNEIFKLSFLVKIKYISMLGCYMLLVYAAGVLYVYNHFFLAVGISMAVAIISILFDMDLKKRI